MAGDIHSIHEFDLAMLCEYFSVLDRQGPGSPETTLRALAFIDGLDAESRIADIGCGTGGQTMVLAANTPGRIIGVDLFPGFIELFNENAEKLKLEHRVSGSVGSMDSLKFDNGSLDLMWSEGAIYNIGFRRGLTEWRRFLKSGGYVAVSEATWFTPERPDEIDRFWKSEYPEIDTIPNKISQMQDAGYIPVASFILPESCWTDHYYAPQVRLQEAFLKKHRGSMAAEDFIASLRHEAELYRRYKEYYGYVFYVGRKR